MSSTARLYKKCGGSIQAYSNHFDGTSLSLENLILVLMFPHRHCIVKPNVVSNINEQPSTVECTSHLYICSLASPMDHHGGGISSTDSCHPGGHNNNYDGPIILQFDTSTRAEMSITLVETDTLDTIKERLQKMLCWNNHELRNEFVVTRRDVERQDQQYIENDSIYSSKTLTYCVLQKRRPRSLGDVKGVVFSLSPIRRRDELSSVVPTILPPIPLLSISFEQIQGRNFSQNDVDILLKQCIKRLMVGRIIVFPLSGCKNDTMRMRDEADFDCFPIGDCTVTVRVPKVSSNYETFVYKVSEALPLLQKSRGSAYSSNYVPNIFIIQPSTRITLMDSKVMEKEVMKPCQKSCSQPSTKVSLSTEELLLRGIHGVRYCSILSSKSYLYHDGGYALDVPRAFLLSGPPGVGKTYAVRLAVEAANAQHDHENETRLISLRGSEILSVGVNEAEAAVELKNKFQGALHFLHKKPERVVVIFMDECDALFSSEVVGATLASLLDNMYSFSGLKCRQSSNIQKFILGWKRMVIIAATNRIDAIPAFLRRPGRFDREMCISPPGYEQRFKILKSLLNHVDQSSSLDVIPEHDLQAVAELCVGYVAADLSSLVRKSEFLSIKDGHSHVTFSCLKRAMRDVGASSLRDSVISSPPATRWDDIAGDAGGAKVGKENVVPKLSINILFQYLKVSY